MAIIKPTEVVGYTVNGEIYHEECRPQGARGCAIFADQDDVQHFCCQECGELLIDIEDNLDTYGHCDYCECDECLEAESIALAGGMPAKCPACLEMFNVHSDNACSGKFVWYCSQECLTDEEGTN
jgi:hypothetical protein